MTKAAEMIARYPNIARALQASEVRDDAVLANEMRRLWAQWAAGEDGDNVFSRIGAEAFAILSRSSTT